VSQIYQIEFDADVLEQIATLEQSEAFMTTIEALSMAKSSVCVAQLRGAIATGQDRQAAMFEAQAQVWDEMPGTIRELAKQWRTKGALRKGQ
jgi:hypothetical protein